MRNRLITTFLILFASNQALAQTEVRPQIPVSDSTVAQTKAHINGDFGQMARRAIAGGQIQEAWDNIDEYGGQFTYQMCDTCTYKMRLRQYMVSVLALPDGEKITAADVGDREAFIVEQREDNKLAIVPVGFGMDTSLIVYGEAGRIYPVYLRAEGVNSQNIPDLVVNISGYIPQSVPKGPVIDNQGLGDGPLALNDLEELKTAAMMDIDGLKSYPPKPTNDFVETIPFDIAKMHGFNNYELWGENWPEDMMPEAVYRDEIFTYVHFGENWQHLELPTAYVVVDDIDEMVNTRINGSTYIIESTRPLISLKMGKTFLCLKYNAAP